MNANLHLAYDGPYPTAVTGWRNRAARAALGIVAALATAGTFTVALLPARAVAELAAEVAAVEVAITPAITPVDIDLIGMSARQPSAPDAARDPRAAGNPI